MGNSLRVALIVPVVLALGPCPPLSAQDATTPGEVTTPYPTIINLAVEWKIRGDDNLNGRVMVKYRRVGEEIWHEAMPLRRVPAGTSAGRTRPTFLWENKHSGSIFDLRPNTEYEIWLKLDDPDGGSAERIVRAKTRGIPKPAPGAVVKKVNPTTFNDAAATAQPGDILLLTPGYYGAFSATRDGAPGKPIVIRGSRGSVIPSTFDSVSLQKRKHLILEEVTVNGSVDLLGAAEVAVRYCVVNAQFGIIAKKPPGAKNCYIADNVVSYIMPWVAVGMGDESVYGGDANIGEGIEITGPGNVICHNGVRGYRDCISTMEDLGAYEQVAIDIYNNDVDVCGDDGIEADFCMGNCRILRNRLTNCFMGLSSQPSLGGPTYFVRNVMYNIIHSPFKLERHSVGNLFLHNTCVKVGDGFRVFHGPNEYSHSLFRNNLCIGGLGGAQYGRYDSGIGRALHTPETDPTNDFDYNGIGTFGTPFMAQIGDERFGSIEELRASPKMKHAILVDMSVFDGVEFPHPPIPERKPADLRLRPGSVAVDAGIRLPNVNDGYRGVGPDLGAYEVGQELPHYGPRSEGVDEETTWSHGIRRDEKK